MQKILGLLSACFLVAAVPGHVQTADYYAGYAGTKAVPPQIAARWLTWAETDIAGARQVAPYHVKTMLYVNPYRIIPGEPMYTGDESTFAHDCKGNRIQTVGGHANQFLMNPASPQMRTLWHDLVAEHAREAHFDAIMTDDAAGDAYVSALPCGYEARAWLDSMIAAQRQVGLPVIYNALEDYLNHGVSKEIALNATAAGGMMEECYSQLQPDSRATGWRWYVAEQTELRMAAAHKYFFCYGRDLTPAESAIGSRLYTYASFLLTYDPKTSVLWEYYQTPTHAHVMPETQLVPLQPRQRIHAVSALRVAGGLYIREYSKCYIAGKYAGGCVAAVNPDDDTRSFRLRGYRRTLVLRGSGVFD
ncbi:MAG: putative glycoside hydrolase, partial [Candidatus Baltobacteraceae bacterium]